MGLIILGGLGFVVWKDLWQIQKDRKDKVPVKRMITMEISDQDRVIHYVIFDLVWYNIDLSV